MGLIVPQTAKVRTSGRMCKHYREKGYEFEKCGDFIEVDVFDLPKGSSTKVKIICDICGKEAEMCYGDVVKCNEENELITCASNSCTNKKREDTCIKKYGANNPSKSQEIKDKKKKTCQLHYGVDNPSKAQEIKNKKIETYRKHYGVDNPNKAQKIKNKKIETYRKHYGVDNPSKAQEIKNKKIETYREHYGVNNPFGSKEIQNKVKKTWQEKYGENITNPMQVESIKEKFKQTMQEKYGENITNPLQVESIKNKVKATNLERYGYEYSFQSKEIQKKIKVTMMKRYGTENPMQNEEIQNKVKATNLERHGAENPMQNEEIKNKALDSFQFNHTGPSSRAQRYINHILNGTLNKHICGSLVDIYMEKENIIIEYDGSGHFLNDKMNGNIFPTKESLLCEKQREDKIINNGYRMIRFIADKDRIPSDEVILNLIEGFKNSDFKVIRINFEEGTIDRDYEEKWYCNFGELRKITKEDLEQFKK